MQKLGKRSLIICKICMNFNDRMGTKYFLWAEQDLGEGNAQGPSQIGASTVMRHEPPG